MKQVKRESKPKCRLNRKNFVSTIRLLELLHMNLFEPSRTMSIGGNYYGLVIVDDFSRFTQTLFIVTKDDAFDVFKRLAKIIQNEKNCTIAAIKLIMGENFKMKDLKSFVKNLVFNIIFHLQELHNKMGL